MALSILKPSLGRSQRKLDDETSKRAAGGATTRLEVRQLFFGRVTTHEFDEKKPVCMLFTKDTPIAHPNTSRWESCPRLKSRRSSLTRAIPKQPSRRTSMEMVPPSNPTSMEVICNTQLHDTPPHNTPPHIPTRRGSLLAMVSRDEENQQTAGNGSSLQAPESPKRHNGIKQRAQPTASDEECTDSNRIYRRSSMTPSLPSRRSSLEPANPCYFFKGGNHANPTTSSSGRSCRRWSLVSRLPGSSIHNQYGFSSTDTSIISDLGSKVERF